MANDDYDDFEDDYDDDFEDYDDDTEGGRAYWLRKALLAGLAAFALFLGFLIPYMLYLNHQVGERFGKLFEMLAGLKDFHMFALTPETIRLVVGFGAAYEVSGPGWSQLTLLTGR